MSNLHIFTTYTLKLKGLFDILPEQCSVENKMIRYLGMSTSYRVFQERHLYALVVCFAFVILCTSAAANTLLGTKHDFTGLNDRAGVVAMPGLAFSDFGTSCVYCHLPPEKEGEDTTQKGGIPGWNRFVPATTNFDLYDSRTLDNKVRTPSPVSLLCLSCHDGTMAVDMTVFRPDAFKTEQDTALHLRINGANNLMNCGKCHNGNAAHSIEIKHLGTDLQNDHPISMTYAGLTHIDPDFRPPDGPYGFDNGVKLYEGKVECASCHNVHNPDIDILLRTSAERLCETCHIK